MTTPTTPHKGGKRVSIPLWMVIATPIFVILLLILTAVMTAKIAGQTNSSRPAAQSTTVKSAPSSASQTPTTTEATSTSPSFSITTPTTVTSTAPPQDFFPEWTGDNAQEFSEKSVQMALDAAFVIDNRVQRTIKVRMTPQDKEYHCGTQTLKGSSAFDTPTIIWCQNDGRFYVQYAAMTSRIGSNRDGAIVDVLQAVGQYLLHLRGNPGGNSACVAGAVAIKLVDTGGLSIEKARNLAAYATDRTGYAAGLDGINKC